jgi:quinolinate synthase
MTVQNAPKSPEELHEILKTVSPSAALCRYDLEACRQMFPLIERINKLKKEKNAVILAHSYVSPEIVYGVADYRGDSYMLSKNAMEAQAETIVFAAVKFMGETAKILSPQKRVLIPGTDTGCTLADAITGSQVKALKQQYPDHAFICYINTTAEVKAECDACVTSSNVYKIVENYPNDKIVFLPDRLMGENLKVEMALRGVQKEIVLVDGSCYVHEQYDPDMIEAMRLDNPGLQVVAHPECSPGIAMHSDYVGSTEQMMQFVSKSPSEQFLLLTECGLTSRLQVEFPDKKFVGSCNMCKYMKSNSLENILRVLENPQASDEIELSEEVVLASKRCIDRMFELAEA